MSYSFQISKISRTYSIRALLSSFPLPESAPFVVLFFYFTLLLKRYREITEYPSTNLRMNRYASFFRGCRSKKTIVDGYSVIDHFRILSAGLDPA